jgi:hypothetical protein
MEVPLISDISRKNLHRFLEELSTIKDISVLVDRKFLSETLRNFRLERQRMIVEHPHKKTAQNRG